MAKNDQIDDSRQRFKDARDRYNKLNQGKFQRESLASDSDSDKVAMATALDYLHQISNKKQIPNITSRPIKSDNNNKTPGLPVPLPVVPVAPEQILIQEKTLTLIDKLTKNASKETTLKIVVTTLVELVSSIERFTTMLIDKFGDITGHWSSRLEKISHDGEKERGWATKLISSMFGKIDHHTLSFAEALEVFTKPIIEATKGTYNILKRQADVFAAVSRKERLDDARDSLEPHALTGLSETLFPKGSIIRSALDTIKGIGNFLKNIGDWGANKLQEQSAKGGIIGNLFAEGGLLFRFLSIFGSISAGLATIVGSAIFASVYSFFKNPDQFGRLLGAFGTLFTEVITPALTWITKEILPPLSIAFAGLSLAFDKLFETVGTVINESLIYIVGTALPAILKELGKAFNTMWQANKEFLLRMMGVFGSGPYAGEGVLQNMAKALLGAADSILEFISLVPTEVLRLLGLADLIGLDKDESIYGRLKRFIMVDVPKFLVGIFNSVMAYITELQPVKWINDQIQGIIDWFIGEKENETDSVITTIKSKVKAFFSNVIDLLTGWIPSWDDMKGWLSAIIPESTPEFLKNWLNKQLGNIKDVSQSSYEAGKELATEGYKNLKTTIDPAMKDIQTRMNNLPLDPWSRNTGLNNGPPLIFAPQNNTTTHNNMSGGNGLDRIGIGSTTAPLSRLDEMIFRANPF